MKTKYILENYDRLIFEIRNPKIIFSHDLIPFLKNFTSDSYLIHKIVFSSQNSTISHTIENPIHNLHPKASKIKIITPGLICDLDQYIPQIIKEINIPNNQPSWHWCANNSNTAYIFHDFEIENLTQEHRFFLYCYHTLKKENFLIKKTNKEIVFKLNSKVKIEQYIYQKQCALQNLSNWLIKEINPLHCSVLSEFSENCDKTDCFKIIYIHLQKLHNFIEKEYKSYLNLDHQIPYRSTFIKDLKNITKINVIKNSLLKNNINDQLAKVVAEPLLKIEKLTVHGNLTYFEFNFCTKIIAKLFKINTSENLTEEAILECLFDLNYNSLQLFKYITGTIIKEVESFECQKEKRKQYFRILKIYNQKTSRNNLRYKKGLPPIKKQITAWIEEEIEYLNKIIDQEFIQHQTQAIVENNSKFLTDLSVAQLAYFIKILIDTKIINHQIAAEVIRFVAINFKTKKAENIAIESLRTKYHNVESSTKTSVATKLVEMLKIAEK